MRDKIVWFGCALLFATGVVAGKFSGPADFFVVQNVHDLFEIAGAGATFVAAIVAVRALGDWRNEFLFSEKYKAIRDFHAACKNDMAAYWYVANGYSLLFDVWNNRDDPDWFRAKTEVYKLKMWESDAKLNGALMLLRHYISDADFEVISKAYDTYFDAVGRGCGELMAFTAECAMMLVEPLDRYEEFSRLRDERRKVLFEATTELEIKADELLARYTRSVRK